MNASSDDDNAEDTSKRRTKASVQDAIGKLIGDDSACEDARRNAAAPAPAGKPPAKE